LQLKKPRRKLKTERKLKMRRLQLRRRHWRMLRLKKMQRKPPKRK